ncbi:B3 domain-containing transcription factor VRN1-like [Euphorbia lathyris]|uniref:B3 domain-containing transcription factor VRN1-like n=1 Tax=Euphorbia lathyris TaxID=212925 RepID=UPI0033130E45
MDSCFRKSNESMLFKAKRPSFFKIILDDTIRQHKLSIPRKFVRNYGNNLSNGVILKVPSGEKWEMDIFKVNGQIWLEKGWDKFMEYYSIVIGSLLVFQYDEINSSFNVTIFDCTCTEIDYPCSHSIINKAAAESQVPKVESEIPVEISADQFSPSRKRKEKSPLSSSPAHKKIKEVEHFTNITRKGTNTEANKENRSLHKQMVNKNVTRKKPYSILKEKSKGIHRESSSFQSENPTFQIAMYPSHVHPSKCSPEIPACFVRKYMKRKDGDALLNVLDKKTWSVKYSSGVRTTRFMHIGWKFFIQDNYLQLGDVCKFELIDREKTLFRVVISRSTTGMKEHPSLHKQMIKSENPTFQIAMCPSYVNPRTCSPELPACFVRTYIKRKDGNALLILLDGKTWSLNYSSGRRTSLLHTGWKKFVQDNNLQVGDVCKFELIDPHKTLFRVVISRSTTRETQFHFFIRLHRHF